MPFQSELDEKIARVPATALFGCFRWENLEAVNQRAVSLESTRKQMYLLGKPLETATEKQSHMLRKDYFVITVFTPISTAVFIKFFVP